MSANIDKPISMHLAHLAGISDFKNWPSMYVRSSYNKHYIIQPIQIVRPAEGIAKQTIVCQFCQKPFELTVPSRTSARRANIIKGIIATVILIALGLAGVGLGIDKGNVGSLLTGILLLGVSGLIAFLYIFSGIGYYDGISIPGDEVTTGHKLLTLADLRKMQSG